jgi:hypothetical protein
MLCGRGGLFELNGLMLPFDGVRSGSPDETEEGDVPPLNIPDLNMYNTLNLCFAFISGGDFVTCDNGR